MLFGWYTVWCMVWNVTCFCVWYGLWCAVWYGVWFDVWYGVWAPVPELATMDGQAPVPEEAQQLNKPHERCF